MSRLNRIHLIQSSSTKLAFFFSTLLVITLFLLSAEVYTLSHGETVKPIITHLILGLVSFICFGLFIVSFHVTKRINTITATADQIITTRDLSKRIPIDNKWDDLSKLARSLNTMLEEIEQLVAGMRQVSDNIAHDLRTPLTRMRNHIESMRNNAVKSCPNSYEKSQQMEEFNTLIAECDGLLATFNALLRIANIESGRRHSGFYAMDLGAVVRDVIELYEPVALEKNIILQSTLQRTPMVGDKDLLFQATANLIDNAIKYTPVGGDIIIDCSPQGNGAKLTIVDTGAGITADQKPLVFRRFFRVSSSRNTQGSGLGLSLVHAIIQLHKGTIRLSDNTPFGLIVTVSL